MRKKFYFFVGLLVMGLLLLTTSIQAQIPSNDLCADAIAITCNTTVSGTTADATIEAEVNGTFCGTSINSPGVWYTVEGTGGEFTASTCNQANYDTKISVFSGDCGSLSCVGGVDDSPGCGLTTEFTWLTTAGATYYILIHGFGGSTGDFDLTITCTIPPEISTTPDEFTFVVPIDGNDSDILSITNSGETDADDLNWTLFKSETAPPPAAFKYGQEDFEQRFVISDQTMTVLSQENISQDVIIGLNRLINTEFTDKNNFAESLRRAIGADNYKTFGLRIMMYASTWDNIDVESEEYLLAQKYAQIEEDKNRPIQPPIMIAGGSDAFGYNFVDSDEVGGPVFAWTDIAATGTEIFSNGDWDFSSFGGADDAYKDVALPFTFNFYGIDHTVARLSSNGYLTFGTDGTDFTNDPIPSAIDPNDYIGAFWDDIDPGVGGTVHYQSDADQFILQFTNVPRFSDNATSLTFQLILNSDGSVLFQYLSMSGTLNSASIGIENANGTIGLQVAFNNGYVKNNLAVLIQPSCTWLSFSPANGVTSLGSTDDVTVSVDAVGLDIDTYLCNINVNSNAVNENPVMIPVTMYVGTPQERIDAVIAKVEDLNDAGVLNNGQANALIVKLEAAMRSLNNSRCQTAVNQLNAFINQVTDFIDDGVLTAEQGNELIDDASNIIEILTPCEESKSGESVSNTLESGDETGFTLEQNSPNPFSEQTMISFSVSEANTASLIVYNTIGQQVAVLFNEMAKAGQYYTVEFDGSIHPKGIYFYSLKSGEKVSTVKKMMLVK